MFIDSHVHLNDDLLYPDIENIIHEAEAVGVRAFVCVGYDRFYGERALEIAAKYPQVYASIGFHPSEVGKIVEEDFAWLERNLENPKVVAVGEIGLDYHWDRTHKEQQIAMFVRQIEIANAHRLPLIIHMRDATEDCYNILKKYKHPELSGVMHCYSGSVESIKEFIDLNMYISLAGPVTFKNAKIPKAVAMEIDSERLMIETDAPYLAPEPYRGKTNVPKYLVKTAEVIAHIRNVPLETIESKTSANTMKLFGINIDL
ncbi:MAG: TatD family hydrolase [Bacilli bacterium]|nr:TatD family hydrolase [Bacilli bacterium]MBN2696622.1 TatD family hydrolase [Bacilli bacterium]